MLRPSRHHRRAHSTNRYSRSTRRAQYGNSADETPTILPKKETRATRVPFSTTPGCNQLVISTAARCKCAVHPCHSPGGRATGTLAALGPRQGDAGPHRGCSHSADDDSENLSARLQSHHEIHDAKYHPGTSPAAASTAGCRIPAAAAFPAPSLRLLRVS